MPVFFFNLRTHSRYIEDDEGMELPNLQAARDQAFAGARGLIAELVKAGTAIENESFVICDEDGTVVARIAFREALTLN